MLVIVDWGYTATSLGKLFPVQPLRLAALLGSIVVLFAADVWGTAPALTAAVLAVAAVAHGARLVLWQPWRTLRTPLVWILHAGYACLVSLIGVMEPGMIGVMEPVSEG